jgi:hypothetical protein
MKIPVIEGMIRRRVLLNYRIDPSAVKKILPYQSPFKFKLVGGYAIAGICLIRLEQIRPKGLPKLLGISSENSAHRIAVDWEKKDGAPCEGVFVPRRDTDSLLNSLAGGRIFPGVHHHSGFTVVDKGGEISMRVKAKDFEKPLLAFEAREAETFPESSVFESLEASSKFFEAGCIGYSSRPDSGKLDGLTLKAMRWEVSSLEVSDLESAYFDDAAIFPPGSIEFDHALLMRDIPHEWHSEPEINIVK